MDPVSVFNALHDTKCIKFGRYSHKTGMVGPYQIDLRRLPLYPELMEAIVTQVYEKFLTEQALAMTMSQLHQRQHKSISCASRVIKASMVESISRELNIMKERQLSDGADSDSQLGEEDLETCSEDCDWDSSGAGHSLDPIISGVPYGAVPVASAVALKAKLPFLFGRKETETALSGRESSSSSSSSLMVDFNEETRCAHPTGGEVYEDQLMGQEMARKPVILIEDFICSGASTLETIRRLEAQNLKVEFVICIIDGEENGVNLLLKEAGIHALSLYRLSAILRVLEATDRITSKQFVSTRKWIDEHQFQTIGVDPSQATSAAQPVQAQTETCDLVATKPRPMIGVASN